jgi:thiol-disulfide isomerase/thioredoxin
MRYFSLLFLWCAALSGQPATRPARELTLTKTNDAGAVTFHLHNEYSAPATGWIVECHGDPDSGGEWTSQWHWSDQEVGLEGKRLEPGKETEYPAAPWTNIARLRELPASLAKCENFQVVAAVFADGTVSGDFTWINAIVAERQKIYEDIAKATDIVTKAIADGADVAATVKQLTEWQQPMARLGNASSFGETNGFRTQPSAQSGRPGVKRLPPRPFAASAVSGVAIGIIQEKQKTLPEAVKVLTDWRDRLGQWDAVTGPAVPSPPPLTMMRNGGSAPPGTLGQKSDLVGKPAPDFVLKDVNGQEVALKDLRGKTVLLDFWATWCEPCRQAMPDIKAAYDEYHDKGLVVVAIDYSESAETARQYFEEQKYPYANLLDPGREAFQKYGGGGIPKVVLIDKDGVVRYLQEGYDSREDLRGEVKKLAQKAAAEPK